ncbi:MAG: hypothetical protein AAFZ65_18280, partial [Planctomycetota bacterium]
MPESNNQPPVVPDGPRNYAPAGRRAVAIALFLGLIAAAIWFDQTSREEEVGSDAELAFALTE